MRKKYHVVKSLEVEKEFVCTSLIKKTALFIKRLPKKVDLRNVCSPIVDQGQLGSCTGNAIASGLREALLIKDNKFKPESCIRLSRLFLYYEERLIEGTVNQDAGAQISDGMKVILNMGVAPETDDPYDINAFTNAPSAVAVKNAIQYKVSSIQNLKNLKEVKNSLANGYPVAFGFEVFESFESAQTAKTGIVPLPKYGEKSLGGHAVCAVGYDDVKGCLIVRNSWGTGWGDQGYFYMPYIFATTKAWDFWTAKS